MSAHNRVFVVQHEPVPHAAAIERDQVRPMSSDEIAAWSEWRAQWDAVREEAGRPPDQPDLGGARTVDVEHAVAKGGGTLCGLPESSIDVYRHLFDTARTYSCGKCSKAAACE